MALLKIIPKVFYTDINIGINFFVKGLGFAERYQEPGFMIIEQDGVVIQLVESEEFASEKDRPEFRIATDDIDAFYKEISTTHPELLHPNLKIIKTQPWGLREFALLDETTVCIVIQQPA